MWPSWWCSQVGTPIFVTPSKIVRRSTFWRTDSSFQSGGGNHETPDRVLPWKAMVCTPLLLEFLKLNVLLISSNCIWLYDDDDIIIKSEWRLFGVRFEDYKATVPKLCYSMQTFQATWYSPNYYMSLVAIIYRYRLEAGGASKWTLNPKSPFFWYTPPCTCFSFCRSVFLKYADRGLVNDRFYYNMNMSLFKVLFWVSNIFLLTINQGMIWVRIIKHGQSNFQNTYRYSTILYNEYFYILY